jgi:hypothetical protein
MVGGLALELMLAMVLEAQLTHGCWSFPCYLREVLLPVGYLIGLQPLAMLEAHMTPVALQLKLPSALLPLLLPPPAEEC